MKKVKLNDTVVYFVSEVLVQVIDPSYGWVKVVSYPPGDMLTSCLVQLGVRILLLLSLLYFAISGRSLISGFKNKSPWERY